MQKNNFIVKSLKTQVRQKTVDFDESPVKKSTRESRRQEAKIQNSNRSKRSSDLDVVSDKKQGNKNKPKLKPSEMTLKEE